jgi:hypothetical protein
MAIMMMQTFIAEAYLPAREYWKQNQARAAAGEVFDNVGLSYSPTRSSLNCLSSQVCLDPMKARRFVSDLFDMLLYLLYS